MARFFSSVAFNSMSVWSRSTDGRGGVSTAFCGDANGGQPNPVSDGEVRSRHDGLRRKGHGIEMAAHYFRVRPFGRNECAGFVQYLYH
jgi:hypothetical protein